MLRGPHVAVGAVLFACVGSAMLVDACGGDDSVAMGSADASSDRTTADVRIDVYGSSDAGASDGLVYDAAGLVDAQDDAPDAADANQPCEAGLLFCGACIDPSSDDKNCGGCNHDCQGAPCDAGLCPVALVAPDQAPWAIAVDSTGVYWTELMPEGGVMTATADGGSVRLATGVSPWGIALDSENIYFTDWDYDAGVRRVPKAGGATVVFSKGQDLPQGIVVDATNVYWVNRWTGEVQAAPKDGGPLTTLASGNVPENIALDPADVYWTENAGSTVRRAPKVGGGATTLVTGVTNPGAIGVTDTTVFFAYAGWIASVPVDGGATTTLAMSNTTYQVGLAVDGKYVYWTNWYQGTVWRLPLGGGTPIKLAEGQAEPAGIAVDATSVYWTNYLSPGSVVRVPK